MNGALNVLAALLLGGAIIAGGWMFSKNQDAAALTAAELEEFKAEYIKEAQEGMTAECDNCCAELAEVKAACEAEPGKLGSLEQPYASGVAVSDINGDPGAQDPNAASSESYTADRKVAVLGASFGGDDSETKRVDKPDTNQYFTEKRRINGKLIDKPDSKDYFTENKRMKDPCVRADGTPYTGSGTADDPFAPGDPCLIEKLVYTPPPDEDPCLEGRTMPMVNEFLEESDPCVTDVTKVPEPPKPEGIVEIPPTWTSPYQTYGPEFPRTTLGPRGSDYPRQMAMVDDYNY